MESVNRKRQQQSSQSREVRNDLRIVVTFKLQRFVLARFLGWVGHRDTPRLARRRSGLDLCDTTMYINRVRMNTNTTCALEYSFAGSVIMALCSRFVFLSSAFSACISSSASSALRLYLLSDAGVTSEAFALPFALCDVWCDISVAGAGSGDRLLRILDKPGATIQKVSEVRLDGIYGDRPDVAGARFGRSMVDG